MRAWMHSPSPTAAPAPLCATLPLCGPSGPPAGGPTVQQRENTGFPMPSPLHWVLRRHTFACSTRIHARISTLQRLWAKLIILPAGCSISSCTGEPRLEFYFCFRVTCVSLTCRVIGNHPGGSQRNHLHSTGCGSTHDQRRHMHARDLPQRNHYQARVAQRLEAGTQ